LVIVAEVLGSITSMREIKFRAWVPEEHKAYTGWGMFYDVEQAYDTLGDMGDGKGGRREYDWQSFYDVLGEANEGKLFLMQYTGLKDKNGKEIYEGDILRAPHCTTGPVEWIDHAFWIRQGDTSHDLLWPNVERAEILGNIYEIPELLTN
jgi:hypothetical protein